MRERLFVASLLSVMVLVPGLAVSQSVQQSGTLTVNGFSGEAPVIQANGRSYVDVEALARITTGSIRYNGNQMTLTLPSPVRGSRMTAPPARQAGAGSVSPAAAVPTAGFSKEFLRAGIEAMAEIREWRSGLEQAVRYGFPPGQGDWTAGYRASAAKGISLASAAASTDDDRKVFQLLNNVFNNMQQLSNQMLQRRKNLTYIAPDALQNDPLDQKILACGHALAAMAAAGRFQDNGACH